MSDLGHDRLRKELVDAFDVEPPPGLGPTATEVAMTWHRRRRLRRFTIGGVVLALITAGFVPLAMDSRVGRTSAAGPTAPSAPAQTDAQLFAPGTEVGASGRVVSVPGHPTRLCAPEDDDEPLYSSGQRPAPRYCPVGVDVTDVDLGRLSRPRTKDGATEGYAWLQGTYTGSELRVDLQQAPRPTSTESTSWTDPPCSKPGGGWASDPQRATELENQLAAYEAGHPSEIASGTVFHPAGGVVLVVTADSPEQVRKALGGDPASLCVVLTHVDVDVLNRAQAAVSAAMSAPSSGVYAVGPQNDEHGQAHIQASVVALTPALTRLQSSFPSGVVEYTPWLTAVPR